MKTGTDTNRATKAGGRGFTLIELLLVVVMIGLLCAVAFPRLSAPVRGAALRESAGVLADTVRFVRAEAVRRGVRTCFKTDNSGTTYWFEVQDRTAGDANAFTRFDSDALDEVRTLPVGVRIGRLEENGQAMTARTIVFNWSGVGVPYRISLLSADGRRMDVKVDAYFDQVQVVAPKADGTDRASDV